MCVILWLKFERCCQQTEINYVEANKQLPKKLWKVPRVILQTSNATAADNQIYIMGSLESHMILKYTSL